MGYRGMPVPHDRRDRAGTRLLGNGFLHLPDGDGVTAGRAVRIMRAINAEAPAKKKPVKFYKVRCPKCGAESYWSRRSRWVCKKCGAKRGLIVNLGYEALRRR